MGAEEEAVEVVEAEALLQNIIHVQYGMNGLHAAIANKQEFVQKK